MPVVDASFLLDLERGLPQAIRALERFDGEWILPYQAALEYLAGAEDVLPAMRSLTRSYRIIHSSDELLLETTRIFGIATRKGKRLSWPDLHIAAVASLHRMEIVTSHERAFSAAGVTTYPYRAQPSEADY